MALTDKQIEKALRAKLGNVTAAARELGYSRTQVYKKINASPALQEVLVEAREELVDIAESALRKEILDGNITAIIFALKTLGKSRGYVERQEVTGADGGALIVGLKIVLSENED